MNEKERNKANEQITRCISEQIQYYQNSILKDLQKSNAYDHLKEVFSVEKPIYKDIFNKLEKIWLEEELESSFTQRLGVEPITRYSLKMSDLYRKTTIKEIKQSYNYNLVEKILEYGELFTTIDWSKTNTIGTYIFKELSNFSTLVEFSHPDSPYKVSKINKKDIKKHSEENENMSKRQVRQELISKKLENFTEIELYNIPIPAKVILFTILSKCPIWPKLMGSIPTNKKHPLGFLSTWFRSFKRRHHNYIYSNQDIWTMNSKEIRSLRDIIWKAKDYSNELEIFKFAREGKVKEVKELLLRGKDVNEKSERKPHMSLLHIAADECNLDLLTMLEKFKPDPNVRNRLLMTPIYYAIENKSIEFISRLISMGADLNVRDKNESTCFYWAVYTSNLEVLKYLANAGAKMYSKNLIRRSPLIKACFLNKPDIVKWLLKFEEVREHVNLRDNRGRTALHAACWGDKGGREGKVVAGELLHDSPESIEPLIEAGADVTF